MSKSAAPPISTSGRSSNEGASEEWMYAQPALGNSIRPATTSDEFVNGEQLLGVTRKNVKGKAREKNFGPIKRVE